MKTIISKLENNVFSGILVRKGKNKISDKDYQMLLTDVNFVTFISLEYLKVEGAQFTKVTKAIKETIEEDLDFENMSYQDLKTYVRQNNIEVPSFKKADILVVLKQIEEKGEKTNATCII